MSQFSQYLFIASMDVAPEREELFNEVYNVEHCPLLSQVPGVISIARFETETLTMTMGGETRTIVVEGQPKHHALYQLESPEVLTSNGSGPGTWEAITPIWGGRWAATPSALKTRRRFVQPSSGPAK